MQAAEEYLDRAEILGAFPLQCRGSQDGVVLPSFSSGPLDDELFLKMDGASTLAPTRLQQVLDLTTELWQQFPLARSALASHL